MMEVSIIDTIDSPINHRPGRRRSRKLKEFYAATTNLEKESEHGLQLVIALFSIPMDDRFERSKFKKHIREQLQEIGFKPSKVSKLINAGEVYFKLMTSFPMILLGYFWMN